jgi:hypothetical protein
MQLLLGSYCGHGALGGSHHRLLYMIAQDVTHGEHTRQLGLKLAVDPHALGWPIVDLAL